MTQPQLSATHLQLIQTNEGVPENPAGPEKLMNLLGIADTVPSGWIEKLPFAPADTTAVTETELQTAVAGSRHAVDLPLTIETSNFFRNIAKRVSRGPLRCDAHRFAYTVQGVPMLRIPVSYLLTQLVVQYANGRFGLEKSGQKVIAYFAPHTPVRQRMLNNLIPDAFCRELFMSPCLSGWHCGEDKHRYMALCHEVLSRSQLNALGKLKRPAAELATDLPGRRLCGLPPDTG